MKGKPEPTDDELVRVFNVIRSSNGPVSRRELAERTSLHDRVVRECVSHLVSDGRPIVTDRKLGGYRMTTDPASIEREARTLRSHAARLMERANALEQGRAGQRELFA